MALHNEIGKIGEKIAQTFLVKQGFTILDMNYPTKYGELDIIATKDGKLRFVEVKSVKVRETAHIDNLHVQPEENLTKNKWSAITISAEIYLSHKSVTCETSWQVDLACVYITTETREGRVVFMENIHKE